MKRATFGCLMAVFLVCSRHGQLRQILAAFGYIGGLEWPGPFSGYVFTMTVCMEARRAKRRTRRQEQPPVATVSNLWCPGVAAAQAKLQFLAGWAHRRALTGLCVCSPEKLLLSQSITGTMVALTFKTTLPFTASQAYFGLSISVPRPVR